MMYNVKKKREKMKEIIRIKSRIDEFDLVLNIPNNWNKKHLIIACHGFDSNKDTEGNLMLEKSAESKGVAFARFSHPYHGERRNNPDDLTVENCIEDMIKVENEIKKRFPGTQIGICSTSFGAYLTLVRLKKYPNSFSSIILKSPAIKMDEILINELIDDDFETFKKQGYSIRYKKETPMTVRYQFYENLKNNRIFDLGMYREKMLIYHGLEDDTAPYEDTKLFADLNSGIKLISLENEGHRFRFNLLEELNNDMVNWVINGRLENLEQHEDGEMIK